MKSVKIFLPVLFFVFTISFAQTKMNMQKVDESALSNGEGYPVDAGPLLERFNKANGIDLEKFEPIPQQLKKTAWNFSFGSPYSWWASDLRTGASPAFYQVPSTCKKVGTNCYVFVQDSLWNSGRVDSNAVDKVAEAFDSKTPSGSINPAQGIYQNDVDTYGTPPNVDNDSKIIILILDIRDGYKGTGGFTAGYFHGYNEGNYTYSNKAEIYYLDGNPLNLKLPGGLTTGMSVTAHEFQHMIQFNYHGILNPGSQETFFNEGCSLVAEVINGYPLFSQSSYYNVSTNRYMLDWNPNNDATDVLKDYSRAARFFLYLKEQFGVGVLKNFTQSSRTGISALDNDALPAVPTTRRFSDIVVDWWIANYLNDKTVAPGLTKWGYDYPNVPKVSTKTIIDPNIPLANDAVYKLGAQYLSYTSGKNLKVNFDTQNNPTVILKAIKTGPAGKQIVDVTPSTDFTVPDFGANYTNVTFLICQNDFSYGNTSQVNKGPYTYYYTSSGTFENKPMEIAYDTTPPVGVYKLSISDTVAVSFDGVAGTRLDSIRVALRNTVPIEGGIWKTSTTKFLTSRLAGPFMVSGIITPPAPNPQPYVYPDPYPNWVKYDLRSLSIDASNNFVVGFVIDGEYVDSSSPTNRVVHTKIPGTSSYHSYTYLHSPSSGTPGWYYIGDGTNISLYLIRAYVSLPTGVKEVIELMPSTFKLAQNYPNPFNPSTVIRYQLPVAGHVSLKVYDMLGREVATLVDEFQPAGPYVKTLHATSLPSGIYFYTLRAGNYLETKKMVLMK
jgi:hypothetical protein